MRRTALLLYKNIRDYTVYCTLVILSYPFSFLPYAALLKIGRVLGWICYYIFPKYRKRTLNNLALACDLKLSPKERKEVALQAFQNLTMTLMELLRLMWRPDEFPSRGRCENQEVFAQAKGKGVVLLSSHQANWEIGIFDLIKGIEGITIGRPLANPFLYRWVLQMRERNGNLIIPPQNALKTGISALNEGKFFAFFADQAKVFSDYHYPFLGFRAYTVATPALLAYKTGSPLCVVTKQREGEKHLHRYSQLIWPDRSKPWKEEVQRIMDEALALVERSVKDNPGEWLWQHRRWKQGMAMVQKKYRHDTLLLILNENCQEEDLKILDSIYPRAAITALIPCPMSLPEKWKWLVYKDLKEVFLEDWSFQMVIDLVGVKGVRKHYLSLGAFQVINHIPRWRDEERATNYGQTLHRRGAEEGARPA